MKDSLGRMGTESEWLCDIGREGKGYGAADSCYGRVFYFHIAAPAWATRGNPPSNSLDHCYQDQPRIIKTHKSCHPSEISFGR